MRTTRSARIHWLHNTSLGIFSRNRTLAGMAFAHRRALRALSLLVEHERAAEVSLGKLEAPQASMCEAAKREEVGFLGAVTWFVLEQ